MSTTMHTKADVTPVDQRTPEVQAALQPGPEALALGLVQTTLAIAKSQANDWLRVVAKLIGFDHEARKAYREGLEAHKRDMGAHVDASGKDPVYVGAMRSALVRFSQLKRLSVALDAGYLPPMVGDEAKTRDATVRDVELAARHPQTRDVRVALAFDSIIAEARLMLAAEGAGSAKGRPAKTFAEKLKAFLEREVTEPAQLGEAAKVVEVMASAFKAPAKGKAAKAAK